MSALGTPATCRHCGTSFAPAGPIIIGQHPDHRTAQYLTTLAQHLHGAHSQALVEAVIAGETLKGILIAGHFEFADGELKSSIDRARRQIHSLTRKVITDANLEAKADTLIKQMAAPGQDHRALPWQTLHEICLQLLRELRDELAEPAPLDPLVSLAGKT